MLPVYLGWKLEMVEINVYCYRGRSDLIYKCPKARHCAENCRRLFGCSFECDKCVLKGTGGASVVGEGFDCDQ